jgi:outer membrane cobalamin receptor
VRTRDGRPLQGARVQLWGSDVQGTTTDAGNFSLAGLPAGTYALEVRAIGYAPKRVPVTLSSRAPGSVGVVLDERLNTLQSVVVQADRTKLNKDYNGFLERQKRGMGRFLSEEDLNRRNPIVITDALRTTPGLSVVPNGTGFGYAIQGRGGCQPDVWVDGMRVFDGATDLDQLVRPTDVAGVEVYNGPGTVPAQFMGAGGGGSCGVVAIWTKRGGPPARTNGR